MKTEEIQKVIAAQRGYFAAGKTLPVEHRVASLKRLKAALEQHEDAVYEALQADLGKSRSESYMCELGMVYSELNFMIRHARALTKEKSVRTPLAQFAAHSYVKPSPKGVVLIMSPWNYPLMLTLDPLVDALAAGNTAIVKPSAYAPHTSAVLSELLSQVFPQELVKVITGGRQENQCLLEQKFDHIFFTGSVSVGKEVLRKAAEYLIPVTLELGGKSPCIVDQTANIPLAARRIVFGKFLNCGQTCVAPDYIYCDEKVCDRLERAIEEEIRRQFGEKPLDNPNYGKIINQKHFDRLMGLLADERPSFGGDSDPNALRIEPTVLNHSDWNVAAMGEEIFGPILPILTYHTIDEAIEQVNNRPHPLALYLFTRSKSAVRQVTDRCPYGGGCINDTIIHLATTNMGFGGFGASGMGAYHGKEGFRTFSHYKSMVDKKNWIDLPMRYQPYTTAKDKLVRMFLR